MARKSRRHSVTIINPFDFLKDDAENRSIKGVLEAATEWMNTPIVIGPPSGTSTGHSFNPLLSLDDGEGERSHVVIDVKGEAAAVQSKKRQRR